METHTSGGKMSDDLDKWERKCARIRKENDKILDKFGVWLYQNYDDDSITDMGEVWGLHF